MFLCFFFFFNDTATTEIYTLSLHDALPISAMVSMTTSADSPMSQRFEVREPCYCFCFCCTGRGIVRSEEHTSELQSPCNLVCRLLLEKKNNNTYKCLSMFSLNMFNRQSSMR